MQTDAYEQSVQPLTADLTDQNKNNERVIIKKADQYFNFKFHRDKEGNLKRFELGFK